VTADPGATQGVFLSVPCCCSSAKASFVASDPGTLLTERPRSCAAPLLLFAVSAFGGCGGSGDSAAGAGGAPRGNAALSRVEYGRLVDVYGLARSGQAMTVVPYRADVLIGPDIQDQREPNSSKQDHEILYDFVSANPDNLQPRLLITREIGSNAFEEALDALDDEVRLVRPARFGDDVATQPFSIVPRNAALRLTFTRSLGVEDGFFVQRDADGRVIGVKNTDAVQLMKIVGDPRDGQHAGDFEVIPARVVVRNDQLIIDPVLLGSEGLQYQTPNSAAGLPEAPDRIGANIRLAIALDGPLRIPGIQEDRVGGLQGANNSGFRSVIRDFRSGNRADDSADVSRGFVRDPIPPRIVGAILMYLERVDPLDERTQVVTIFKSNVVHEIDRGDVLRFVVDNSGVPVAVTEVAVDPADDRGRPDAKRVRVIVSSRDVLEKIDPTNRLDFPSDPSKRDAWLVQNAPKAVLVAEYTAERVENGVLVRDDPRYFMTFSPSPLPKELDGQLFPSEPNENVSPFASAIVRFTKPLDLATVKAYDTLFFGTRDLLSVDAIEEFKDAFLLTAQAFDVDKYMTPHLVGARVRDEDGSQTAMRLQPELGFYLDEAMRQATVDLPFRKIGDQSSMKRNTFRYFLHLKAGLDGIKDLSGNALDFQSGGTPRDSLVVDFGLDTRKGASGLPLFPDNLAVTIARRFTKKDEDEQPSYYLNELSQDNPNKALAFRLPDLFGSVTYFADGTLGARPGSRISRIVDDLNQQPPPPQGSGGQPNPLRFCPFQIGTEGQVATATASVKFPAPLQNPLNPFGCRLQTIWREIDMSLSRTDPDDFNLDVEQMYWAPFTAAPIVFDEFDRQSLFLNHSEFRTEPCVNDWGALPSMPSSGLSTKFSGNAVENLTPGGTRDSQPVSHTAYADKNLVISPNLAFTEPTGVNRFLPLPRFDRPYFVWRDETVSEQGGNCKLGRDTNVVLAGNFTPYIISPFLAGRGRFATGTSSVALSTGYWDNRNNFGIANRGTAEIRTGGLVGSIALPLLADFWTYPDKEDLPIDNPFRAAGANGWQIALAVQSSSVPAFRAYSAGGRAGTSTTIVAPGQPEWETASGGISPINGRRTTSSDNSVFWAVADFLKRQTVVTSGFVDIANPHRMPSAGGALPDGFADPRLGPYFGEAVPPTHRPVFSYTFEPPLALLPGGTTVIPEFRAAGIVDPEAWAAVENSYTPAPTPVNFPLDPLKAGDAHIRKLDDRVIAGQIRNYWTYYYNRNVTSYVADPNMLMNDSFLSRYAGPNESFRARDVKYFNWRFIMKNNVEANPPVAPVIDSFAVTYRFERTQ
jgi:hypothetical protein